MSRVILVPPDAGLLADPSTVHLHTYLSGEMLVRTDARTSESEAGRETAVETGIRIGPDRSVEATQRHGLADLPEKDGLAYVELIGPVDPAWPDAIASTGLAVLRYVPNHAYLCRGPRAAFEAAARLAMVEDIVPLTSDFKPGPRLTEAGATVWIVIQASEAEAGQVSATLDAFDGVEIDHRRRPEVADVYLRIKADVSAEGEQQLRTHPLVVAIEPYSPRTPEDELAGLVIAGQYDDSGHPAGSYLTWLEDHAMTGEGVSIGIVDSGVQVDHPAFGDRARAGAGAALSWHGTFVAGHAAGNYQDDKDPEGYIYGLGTAPAARILAQDNSRNPADICRETLGELDGDAVYAVVQNNSWGAGLKNPMDYGSLEAQYDALVRNAAGNAVGAKPLTICFSSGNSGPNGLTRPKAAKNIIVTGNSEIYRPTVGLTESDNIDEVYEGDHGSSWGNCGDGRIRPDVVAPGEWTAAAGYDTHPGEAEYINDRLTWGGGSSGASPKTAGACALLMQWWRGHTGSEPSPAMLRALIVNGASDMGVDGGIPSRRQGWGRLNLDPVVDDTVHHTYIDQSVLLRARGEQASYTLRQSDPERPVLVTLCWTDPPAALGSGTAAAPAIVNRLALRVTAGERNYFGNALKNGWSDADAAGNKEGLDNLQNVFLPPGSVAATFSVTVAALEITTDCLTNQATNPQQDFALVVTNGFLDEDATPADVFLVIDGEAVRDSEDTASTRDDDLAPAMDAEAMRSSLWAGRPPGAPAARPGSDNGHHGAHGGWWDQPGIAWPAAETGRRAAAADAAAHAGLLRGAAAGIDLACSGTGARLVCAAGDGDAVRAAEGERGQAQQQAGAASRLALGVQLAALRAWLGRPAAPGGARRRSAVVAVGPASTIGAADLDALRHTAFVADLLVVSHDAPTLAWLAQRIHRRTGARFRLAQDAAALGGAIRDTLIEAAGGQIVTVRALPGQEGSRGSVLHAFLVGSHDRRICIHVDIPEGAQLDTVRLHRPGQSYSLDAGQPRAGHRLQFAPERMAADIDLLPNGQDWAGEWKVEAALTGGGAAPATIRVWAWGTLRIPVTLADAPAGESKGDAPAYVARIGDRQAMVEGADVARVGSGGQGEAPRRIRPRRRRLAQVAPAGETTRQVERDDDAQALSSSSGRLAAVLRAGRPGGATVLEDYAIAAYGSTGRGEPFARALRLNLLRLEPRSAWRQRLQRQAQPHLLAAGVGAIRRTGDEVTALLLKQGTRQKGVAVASPILRRYLARADLAAPGWLFGVAGSRLIAAVRDLAPPGSDPDAEYGIEQSIPDRAGPAPVAGEQPEFPLASRFVLARHARRPATARTISRIVLHITDGGPGIDGPVSWFQNPLKADGSPLAASVHYVLGQNGEIVQMVKHGDIAFHSRAANGNSIGIEHCARAARAGVAALYPTALQYAASAALVRWLCEAYGIPMDRDHILGHGEADPGTAHAGCPDAVWNWDYYMALVTQGTPLTNET